MSINLTLTLKLFQSYFYCCISLVVTFLKLVVLSVLFCASVALCSSVGCLHVVVSLSA